MTWQAHANLLWIKRPEKLAGPELTGCHGSSGGCIPAQDTGAEGLWGRRAPGGRCGGGRGGSEKPDCPGEGLPASSKEPTTYTPIESQQGTRSRRETRAGGSGEREQWRPTGSQLQVHLRSPGWSSSPENPSGVESKEEVGRGRTKGFSPPVIRGWASSRHWTTGERL